MRTLTPILVLAALGITMTVVPAAAGYQEQWVKFRTRMDARPTRTAMV